MKHDGTVNYFVGDLVRIYKYKNTYTKNSGSRFREEMFKVRDVQDTIPYTLLLDDLNREVIKGSFYLFELISLANKN